MRDQSIHPAYLTYVDTSRQESFQRQKLALNKENGIYSFTLPPGRRSGVSVLFFPITGKIENNERLIFIMKDDTEINLTPEKSWDKKEENGSFEIIKIQIISIEKYYSPTPDIEEVKN